MFPAAPHTPGSFDADGARATLSRLRTQAKDLLKAFRAADPQARARVAAQLPRFTQSQPATHPSRPFALADALHVIAREQGFRSWPKLKAQIEAQSDPLAQNAPTPAAAEEPARSATGQSTRATAARERLAQTAAQIVELARSGQIERLARLVTSAPRYETLAIRDRIVARGEQTVVVDALLIGLRHADPRIRFDCAHALDHYADDRCAGPLRQLLGDPVPRVRRMALHSLSCDACKVAPLPMIASPDASAGSDTSPDSGADLVALVVARALGDPSVNVRRHATIALGACCGDARAVGALQTLLATERDPAILRNARWALRTPRSATTHDS